MSSQYISVSKLKKYLSGNLILDIDNFVVEQGKFVCLLGPSGCGKSTLLNILSGFIHPSEGEVLIQGNKILASSYKFIQIFQEYGLFPWRTVLDNVKFGLEIQKKSVQDSLNDTANHYVNLVGLQGYEYHYPDEISGGMKQRVAIARALAVNPEVLFMDEPFGALDALTRLNMQQEIEKIWLETRKTILFVTHSIEEAIFLGDKVVVMSSNPGKIKKVFDIDVPRPRNKFDETLLETQKQIYAELGLL